MGAWYIYSFDDETETRHTSRRPSKMGTCTLTQVHVAVYTRTVEIQEHKNTRACTLSVKGIQLCDEHWIVGDPIWPDFKKSFKI
jgi:hypothetical protein